MDYGKKELFRYGIISPLIQKFLSGEKVGQADFEKIAQEKYYFKGKTYNYSKETIKKWYYKYQKNGLSELENKVRSDKEKSRKVDLESIRYIVDLKSKYPRMTTKNVYNRLLEEGYITSNINIRSFYRYLKSNDLKREVIVRTERRKYEVSEPNEVWQGDTSYGPYIVINGKKYRTYLIHFIDDCSRMIVGYGFYLNDNGINVQKTLKKAIRTYGIPRKIYLDNGKSYKNEQLSFICARLGIKESHTRAYDPESKGKVERIFKTIKEGWMYAEDWNKFNSLEELEKSYEEYIFKNYINKVHSELKKTPNQVWHSKINEMIYRRISEEQLEEAFYHQVKRKVNNDGTITIEGELYEVPQKYIKENIEIRYYAENKDNMWIYENGKKQEKVKKLDKVANSKIPRKNGIDYSKMINKEEDVIDLGEENEIS